MGVFFVWGVVFVCVEGVDFDGRRVFLEWKWWFSNGGRVDLRFGRGIWVWEGGFWMGGSTAQPAILAEQIFDLRLRVSIWCAGSFE